MFVLSRGVVQAMAISRDAQGRTNGRHPLRTRVFMPKLDDYGVSWSVKEGQALGKTWTVCIVPDGTVIPAAALADPDILVLNQTRDVALTLAERTAITTKLALTDFGASVAVLTGDTLNDVVDKIVKTALGHTSAFVASAAHPVLAQQVIG